MSVTALLSPFLDFLLWILFSDCSESLFDAFAVMKRVPVASWWSPAERANIRSSTFIMLAWTSCLRSGLEHKCCPLFVQMHAHILAVCCSLLLSRGHTVCQSYTSRILSSACLLSLALVLIFTNIAHNNGRDYHSSCYIGQLVIYVILLNETEGRRKEWRSKPSILCWVE